MQFLVRIAHVRRAFSIADIDANHCTFHARLWSPARAKINAALIWFPMCCRSVGCGTLSRMTRLATRSSTAAHIVPWFAFTMTLAMWSRRTSTMFLASLRRPFVSGPNCVLLGHVFALPRCAVKGRAFAMVNACLRVNPYQARTTARRLRIRGFFGCGPCWPCSRTRFPLRFRFLGSRFCFGWSRWRLSGWRRCSFLRRWGWCGGRFAGGGWFVRGGWLSLHTAGSGKSDCRHEGKKFGSHIQGISHNSLQTAVAKPWKSMNCVDLESWFGVIVEAGEHLAQHGFTAPAPLETGLIVAA